MERTTSFIGKVSLLLFLFSCPSLNRCECVFGPDNLALRNNTIMSIMNYTLINRTNIANQTIGNFNGVTLWSYLQQVYSATPSNYLEFVGTGKLWAINWTVVSSESGNVNRSLASYLLNDYSIPVHEKLQNLATNYSFSYGIFRPNRTQFWFTGMNNYSLDPTCTAGSSFLWRLSTNVAYHADFNYRRSFLFARLAMTLENAFSEYYRRPTSPFNTDFVRANLLYANMSSEVVIPYLETYFLNSSLTNSILAALTNTSQLPAMTFDNGTGKDGPFVIRTDPQYTRIVLVAYPASDAKSPSQLITALTNATTLTTFQTTMSSGVAPTDGPPSSSVISSNHPETTVNTSISTAAMTTLPSSHLSTILTSPTNLTSNVSTNYAFINAPAATSSTIQITSETVKPSSVEASLSSNVTVANFQTSSTVFNAAVTAVDSSSNALMNASTSNSYGSFSSTTMSTTLPVQTTLSNNFTSARTQNVSASLTNPTYKTAQRETSTGVTFDPDPFFKATVPVITKVYNDEYLLRMKMGTMAPLTQHASFFSVTIPAAIGIVVLATVCMGCWQISWFHGSNKL